MTDIMEQIGLPALLEQLAEECGELTHACLKFARCLRGENPTPKTEKECRDALTEEVADVTLCIRLIIEGYVIDPDKVNDIVEEKMQRWHERLEEAEEKPSAQPEKRTEERTETHGVCLDTISRNAVIDEIIEYGSQDTIYMSVGELKRRIEQLPSVQPEQRWIPVEERLPEPWTLVLVTDSCKNVSVCQMAFNPIDGWYNEYENWTYFSTSVIAWMPLPEPYQGGKRDE